MTYLFLEDSETLVQKLKTKFDKLNMFGNTSGLHRKWRTAYNAYYSNYFTDSVGLGTAGEQGELSTLHVNHARNIVRHIHNMVTTNRLVFDSLAINSDVQSRNSAVVANAILEYYFYEKKFEVQTKAALEMALIFGTSFLKVCWEPNQEIYGVDGMGQPVYNGCPRFIAYSPYDVLIDPTKDDFRRQNWVVCREIANKWDLIALNPEKADEIENLPKINTLQHFLPHWDVDEDSVWLFKAYHKATPSLPLGRYTEFCEGGLILDDKENMYPGLPVFCLRPEVKYGGAYGHATLFDLLPAQEAHNLLHSSIISNQKAFAVQNIATFQESAINPMELPGQLNVLQCKLVEGAPNGGLPQALQLCATPNEVFGYAKDIVSQMEMVSGVNSAARGAPPNNLTSGTAIALVSTAANNFNNSVESSYASLCEEASTFLVQLLKMYMKTEELIAISGKNESYSVESFTGGDLQHIQRVRINVGNPISKTLSGKVMIADNLLMNQTIKTPAEYLEVLQTGTITPILEQGTAQDRYVKDENDLLARGEEVQMLAYDNHNLHIQEHLVLTFRPDIRKNQAIMAGILAHIQEHIDQFEIMSLENPQGLAVALGQPIQVAPPAPPAPGGAPQPGGGGQKPPGNPMGMPANEKPSQSAESALSNGAEGVAQSAAKRADKLSNGAA